jgi:oxalate---CoA ligase
MDDSMDGPRTLTIASLLRVRAGLHPHDLALLASDTPPTTYASLLHDVQCLASGLKARGLGPGDRVAIVLPNGPEAVLAFLGVAAVASAAPLNPAYRENEFAFYLADLAPKIVLTTQDAPACRAAAQALQLPVVELSELRSPAHAQLSWAQPEEEALVLHTSGTTARPKLVPLTQSNLCHSALNVAATLALQPSDRCLNVMPLFHIHGLVAALLASLAAGSSLVATTGFDPTRFFDWLAAFQPTWYTAVPTMHQAVSGEARRRRFTAPPAPLRFIRSSSAALPPALLHELEALFEAPVIEAYGMTEAAHQVASNPLPPLPRQPGSVGLPAGPDIAVLGPGGQPLDNGREGEIAIRGPNVTSGYVNHPAANQEAFTGGWFRTGDLGRFDADGYLHLTGRSKEIINRGGEKIAPVEVDHCLIEHPAVAQAVTFAIPHTSLGQDVAAAVVLREGFTSSDHEIRRFAASRLAPFKVPSRILILPEIPKGPTGKIQRIGLAERLGLLNGPAQPVQPAAQYAAPRSPLEAALVELWKQALQVERVGIHDDFRQLGGDSLSAATLLTQISATYEVPPETLVFEEVPTVAEMAERLQANGLP